MHVPHFGNLCCRQWHLPPSIPYTTTFISTTHYQRIQRKFKKEKKRERGREIERKPYYENKAGSKSLQSLHPSTRSSLCSSSSIETVQAPLPTQISYYHLTQNILNIKLSLQILLELLNVSETCIPQVTFPFPQLGEEPSAPPHSLSAFLCNCL